jgi:hypothetical protein
MINCHLLLGGIAGPDGWATSAGMFDLRRQLATLPEVACFTYTWNDWQKAANDIAAVTPRPRRAELSPTDAPSRPARTTSPRA